MKLPTTFMVALCAFCSLSGLGHATPEPAKAAAPAKATAEAASGNDVARYCSTVAPVAAEVRMARQVKRLTELETEIKQRVQELEQKEAEARDWVSKRQTMMQKATDAVVAIFSKMEPEAAATRIAMLEDETAVAILSKLTPKAAGAIMNEMDASRVGKLTILMSGATGAAKRS